MWTIYVQTQLAKKGNLQNLNQCQFTNQEQKKKSVITNVMNIQKL